MHVLDLGANYWSLWTEADNLVRYHEKYPRGFTRLNQRMGYRVRPSWVWQRKRYGASELVVALANDGVAGVPGILRLTFSTPDGKPIVSGTLDAGHPHGGKIRQAAFPIPREFQESSVLLRAEIETKGGIRRPVRWACEQPLEQGGSLRIQLKKQSDTDWRKGV